MCVGGGREGGGRGKDGATSARQRTQHEKDGGEMGRRGGSLTAIKSLH